MLTAILMLTSAILAVLMYAATKRAEAYNEDAALLELEIEEDYKLIMELTDALSQYPGNGELIAQAHRHVQRP